MDHDEGSFVTVEATFHDTVGAEIACALLSDASLQADEPEAVGLRLWLVQVRGIAPALAPRAEAVLRSAQALEVRIVPGGWQQAHAEPLLENVGASMRGRITAQPQIAAP